MVQENPELQDPRIVVSTPEDTDQRPQPDPRLTADTMEQIRKWGCQFDGKDALSFLERIDELRQGFGFSKAQLVQSLPVLLKGEALLWYRNIRDNISTWDEFEKELKLYYTPRKYKTQLEREIRDRVQHPDESFAHYATALQTLMRRAGQNSEDERIDRLIENMKPSYQRFIRPEEYYG
jgi:Retrotransposon gag protein.